MLSLEPGGLGTETGKLLRAQGSKLALLYAPFEAERRQQVLEETYGSASSPDISTFECDITSDRSIQSAFVAIREQLLDVPSPPFPSILVNAAGYVSTAPLEETTTEEAQKHLNANLLGPFLVSQAFANLYFGQASSLKAKDGSTAIPPGRIVSISSQAAHVALPWHGAYCASKAGLMGLTNCMAAEWGGRGITANTVSPTVAMTALGKKAWADEERKQKMLEQIPTGRFAQPFEIAEAIVYLCQDSSGMINGADIRIDGGFTIR